VRGGLTRLLHGRAVLVVVGGTRSGARRGCTLAHELLDLALLGLAVRALVDVVAVLAVEQPLHLLERLLYLVLDRRLRPLGDVAIEDSGVEIRLRRRNRGRCWVRLDVSS
tara:strand:+ start:539 stop:868 length:330 start_codon:yes stop_codon:yes gene_type:complete